MASQNLMTSKIAGTPQCGCVIGSTKILYCRKEGYDKKQRYDNTRKKKCYFSYYYHKISDFY